MSADFSMWQVLQLRNLSRILLNIDVTLQGDKGEVGLQGVKGEQGEMVCVNVHWVNEMVIFYTVGAYRRPRRR